MKINEGEIRLGNGDVIPCEDISVDLSSDDPISNVSRSDECEEISLGLHEGIVTILKKCLAAKYKRNFDRCKACKYFMINVDADTGCSSFCCGFGVSPLDMLSGDVCLLV